MAQEFPDDATSAAVIGCGPVGLMAILAAQAQGAQKVHICLLVLYTVSLCSTSVSCVSICLLCVTSVSCVFPSWTCHVMLIVQIYVLT